MGGTPRRDDLRFRGLRLGTGRKEVGFFLRRSGHEPQIGVITAAGRLLLLEGYRVIIPLSTRFEARRIAEARKAMEKLAREMGVTLDEIVGSGAGKTAKSGAQTDINSATICRLPHNRPVIARRELP